MITDQIHIDFIKKRKNLQRIGQTPGDAESEAAREQNRLDQVLKSYEGNAEIATKFTQILAKVRLEDQLVQAGLAHTVAILNDYNSSIIRVAQNASYFEEIEKGIAKTLGITTKQSYELSRSSDHYVSRLKITRSQLDQYRSTFESILPGQAKQIGFYKELTEEDKKRDAAAYKAAEQQNNYNEVLFESQRIMQDYLGMSAEDAAAYTLYTEASGKNIASQLLATKKLANTWDTATGQVGSFKYIMDGLTKLTVSTRSELGRIPGSLEMAILKTKHLGISLETISSASERLLNIEQSVGKEIEFQLITGKKLVDSQGRSLTNRLREAKLLGDPIKMAEAMNDLLEQNGEILRTGTFMEKKALADATEMQLDDLIIAEKKLSLTKKMAAIRGQSYEDFINLPPEQQQKIQVEYEAALSKSSTAEAKQQLEDIRALKKQEIDLKSPADRTALLLKQMVDEGIIIKKFATGAPTFDPSAFVQEVKKLPVYQLAENQRFIEQVGLAQQALKTATPSINKFKDALDLIPTDIKDVGVKLTAGVIQTVKESLKKLTLFGVSVAPIEGRSDAETNSSTSTSSGTENTQRQPNRDAIIINDGLVIEPHPSDKIKPVKTPPGSSNNITVLGTSIAGNSKLADVLSGITNNETKSAAPITVNNQIDTSKIVSAIQSALSTINIVVNLDPMAVQKEIEFKTARIN